jgi:hypothetical protein
MDNDVPVLLLGFESQKLANVRAEMPIKPDVEKQEPEIVIHRSKKLNEGTWRRIRETGYKG